MARLGILYGVADFIQKTVPVKLSNHFNSVIGFLKALSAAQERNFAFDTSVHANDGIWIWYQGVKLCMVKPAQSHLSVLVWPEKDNHSNRQLLTKLKSLVDADKAELLQSNTPYRTWRVDDEGLSYLQTFFDELPIPDYADDGTDAQHARRFPGDVREAALQAFEDSGSRCPGVLTPPHELEDTDRIVFDHILPYSRRGDNSLENIQVLCARCNGRKAASALGNAST